MRPGGYIELINDRVQKIEIIKSNKVTVKKYNGNMDSEYMKSVS